MQTDSIAERRGADTTVRRSRDSAEHPFATALDRLASATQGMVSKRIDLVMLENHELASALLFKSVLVGIGIVLGLGAWFSATTAAVFLLAPAAGTVAHLACLAVIHAAVATFVVARAMSAGRVAGHAERRSSRRGGAHADHGGDLHEQETTR